jgi:hypothetical protein
VGCGIWDHVSRVAENRGGDDPKIGISRTPNQVLSGLLLNIFRLFMAYMVIKEVVKWIIKSMLTSRRRAHLS